MSDDWWKKRLRILGNGDVGTIAPPHWIAKNIVQKLRAGEDTMNQLIILGASKGAESAGDDLLACMMYVDYAMANPQLSAAKILGIPKEPEPEKPKPMTNAEIAAQFRTIAAYSWEAKRGTGEKLDFLAKAVEALPEPPKPAEFLALVQEHYESIQEAGERPLNSIPYAYYRISKSLDWLREFSGTRTGVHPTELRLKFAECAALCWHAYEDIEAE